MCIRIDALKHKFGMRILICSGNFFPEKTGIGKYSAEMAAWFAARGHEVEVVTGFPYYPEFRLSAPYTRTRNLKVEWRGVTVYRVPHYIPKDGQVNSRRRILIDLTMFLGTSYRWMGLILGGAVSKKKRPDVVITVCPPLISGIWPLLASRLLGVPWVYHVQDFQVDAAMRLSMIPQGLLGRALYWLENKLITSASRVSSITPAMCRRAITKGAAPERVLSVPNWGDVHNIYPISAETGFRKLLGLTEDQIVVMFAGAMGRKHGLGLVLDAAERLLGNACFHFVMIGSGSDAETHREDAQRRQLHNMTFLPLQPAELMNEVLGTADIHLVVQKVGAADLVMPSRLTNILAAGRPTITTAEEGTELYQVVHDAKTGISVPPEDLHAFVKALEILADDADLRDEFGRNARAYAQMHLSQDVILASFERELVKLCRPGLPATTQTHLAPPENLVPQSEEQQKKKGL
jgi:colanic acid biosynthesis glycosyl transferase WcaI